MPKRHPIIPNVMGLRGLMNEAAEAMIAESVDAVSKAQDDDNAQDLKEQFERQQLEERAKRENMPMVYVLKEQYHQLYPSVIREKEEKYHCVLIPVEEYEIQRMKENAVEYTMPPEVPDARMLTPIVTPHVKGGRYHEPPRDLKKKKKAKRRQQKQARRRNK